VIRRTLSCGAALVVLAVAAAPSAAQDAPYAHLKTSGPPLSVPQSELRASLQCSGGAGDPSRPPVLLLSGTTVDPDENFAWNWEPALTAAGFAWCASTAPGGNMDDIQVRGEYVVYAIRRMFAATDRRIAIYGHSQGGMVGRWALRFWPDTRKMVDDVVGAAPSNQGTDTAVPVCALGCAPALWQQETGSEFTTALNSRAETFRGISYTDVYSHMDEVVFPNLDDSGRSSLHTGDGKIANVAVQDVCPGEIADHLTLGTVDPVAWALFGDAVEHPGPADPSRIAASVCAEGLMPGVDRATYATDFAAAAAALANRLVNYPHVDREPRLRHYVLAR
jgi:pimeloyl-ACP methyl ester carboxylesterase